MQHAFLKGAVAVCAFLLARPAAAADLGTMPVKALPVPASPDWTGFYLGGHFGYATGTSNWAATQGGGAAALNGSLDLFNSFDAFKGTGSYFAGLQAGYNRMFPSRFLLGVAMDFSAPNTIAGSQTVSSAASGQASYIDTVTDFGTLRGRFGYDFDHWLVYGTGGVAWTYDKLERTQLAGMPVGGNVAIGTTEAALLWRWGWAAGAGVEVLIAQNWTAKLEFLTTEFGNRQKSFPSAGQAFTSDLSVQSLQLGVNYQLGADLSKSDVFTKGIPPFNSDTFNIHGQTTLVSQYALPFRAPYSGQNSLAPNAGRETLDIDLYLGFRPWKGAEIWIDPEIDQGFGLSGTFGVAGFPSGEAYKVGEAVPYARVSRAFIRQTIDLGGDMQKVDADQNVFSGSQAANRLVLTIGKFAVTDIFDTNKYAHDPKNDFMNWAMIDTGTFDYAADAWGFTYGAAAEWYQGDWTVRGGVFDLPIVPNSTDLDASFGQFQWIGEIERRWELWSHPGKIAVTGFLTRARLGTFQDAVALAQALGVGADTTPVRQFRSRGGISMNAEQEITSDLGVFLRAGVANGDVEPDVYTDIDRTV